MQLGHLGDLPRVRDRLRDLREQPGHLVGALEEELAGLELQAVGRVEVGGGAHAEQDVVRLRLALVHVVQVVGGDQRQADLGRQAAKLFEQAPLLGQAVVLDLEEEVARAEDVAVVAGQAARQLPVLDLQRPWDLAVEAGGQADQPLRVLGKVLTIDARLVVIAVEVGVGDDAAEVAVAGPVLGQQDEVKGLGIGLAFAVGHRASGDVGLDADDGLDLPLLAGLVEGDRTVQRAVIGDGQAVEALCAGL